MDRWTVVEGRLFGKGFTAPCLARVQDECAVLNIFARCSIIESPIELPDGIYELRFLNQSAFVRRISGQWSEGFPWANSAPEPAGQGK